MLQIEEEREADRTKETEYIEPKDPMDKSEPSKSS